ncbi:SRPBCC family protein [Bosea vestrisii]|uniref:SRPBCC family protein n=1 Tax=Bosea vestrisii TaxID=151416 RepID=UPI0024DFC4BC|nr:SRPBCC family protein [Bosea vestrisii]WID97446.1 SRPBCC family protein [Bosea vestrisii]
MAKAFFSTVIDHSADAVWSVIRPFGHYAWAGVRSETIIEEGRAGDQVGSVRRVGTGGTALRQILLAHSDMDRCYSYAFASPPPFPVENYLATIRVTPVVETGQAFIEWWATFDCSGEDRERMTDHFERKGFAVWLAALRAFMAKSS